MWSSPISLETPGLRVVAAGCPASEVEDLQQDVARHSCLHETVLLLLPDGESFGHAGGICIRPKGVQSQCRRAFADWTPALHFLRSLLPGDVDILISVMTAY